MISFKNGILKKFQITRGDGTSKTTMIEKKLDNKLVFLTSAINQKVT